MKKRIKKVLLKMANYILPNWRNVFTIDELWENALEREIKTLKFQQKIKRS